MAQDKPKSKAQQYRKAKSSSDTTVITPRYKVTQDEIASNVVSSAGKGIGTSFFVKNPSGNGTDTTRLKMQANEKNLLTTMKRNSERAKEGQQKIPVKASNPGTWIEKNGLTYKEKPIKKESPKVSLERLTQVADSVDRRSKFETHAAMDVIKKKGDMKLVDGLMKDATMNKEKAKRYRAIIKKHQK